MHITGDLNNVRWYSCNLSNDNKKNFRFYLLTLGNL